MRNPNRFRASKKLRKDYEAENGKMSGRQWNKLRKTYQRSIRAANKARKG